MRQEEVFKFCLDTKNNGALPLDLACHERLSVHSLTVLPYHRFMSMDLLAQNESKWPL
jgi:hypothetical protein